MTLFCVQFDFSGPVFFWKGPSPWYYVAMPEAQSAELQAVSSLVTYGWGVIPVTVRLGRTVWTTSLFPKDGRYLVPLKAAVRKAEMVEEGTVVALRLEVGR